MEGLINDQLGQADMISTFITNYKKDGQIRRTKKYYEKKIESFQRLWDDFEQGHKKLLMAKRADKKFIEATSEYFLQDTYGEMETLFFSTYEAMQQRFEEEHPPETETNFNTTTVNESVAVRFNEDFGIKLPKITLDKFSGDYKKWPTFHDLFKTLVHENHKLNEVQKLQYLKIHLSGEAEQLLRHFQVTERNYAAAWSLLEDRYNNKRVLVNTQLKVLLSQNNIMTESAQAVKGLLDTTSECLQALKNLDVDITNWDPIIVFLLIQKLPQDSHQLWEQEISKTKDLPSWSVLKGFLETRFRTLEAINCKRFTTREPKPQLNPKVHKFTSNHVNTISSCILCAGQHSLRKCEKFLALNPMKRFEVVKAKGLCINCLGTGHLSSKCPSKHTCQHCKRQHHTLLHRQSTNNENSNNTYAQSQSQTSVNNSIVQQNRLNPKNPPFVPASNTAPEFGAFLVNGNRTTQSLLATAIVKIVSSEGRELTARALIDQGSQATFITEHIAQTLRLKRTIIHATVNGVGDNSAQTVTSSTNFILKSILPSSGFEIEINALILKKLTSILPNRNIKCGNWTHINNLQLADPCFYKSQRIDMLIGADIYSQIILEGLIKGEAGSPIAQKTTLGWILSGKIHENDNWALQINNHHVYSNLNEQLQAFWKIEELKTEATTYNEEETICEEVYERTTTRLKNGQYEVELPLKPETEKLYLGKSREIAVRRLFQMEKRLTKDKKLKQEYSNCIREYLTLGHMEPVYSTEDDHALKKANTTSYTCSYLPHHAVIKETSTTTKLRVVFDASRATQSEVSLNDMMLKGPVVQDDLTSIILRWRKHKIGFTADIEKMYRQIRIKPVQADLQRIVWRDDEQQHIQDYRLLTVTFGTKSAPYLATRTIKKLAHDEEHNYPLASKIAQTDFYVDDLLSGADTLDQAKEIRDQMIGLMKAGCFHLRKWVSNEKELFTRVETSSTTAIMLPSADEGAESIKTLGIYWSPNNDAFTYSVTLDNSETSWSKRKILSQIAKLFDPAGWLSPIIIRGKIIMQKLWLSGTGWDDRVPEDLCKDWKNYFDQLKSIEQITIERWIGCSQSNENIELHGFADASTQAYAAVLYLCTTDSAGIRKCQLLASKTKVAPIKTITLPRLELCAAHLLSKLFQYVTKALKLNHGVTLYAWSDSEIVLAWLKSHPTKWKTFVANRVSDIHTRLGSNIWHYVPTKENPADCASRGMYASELNAHDLWWHGPAWLKQTKEYWPQARGTQKTIIEQKKTILCNQILASGVKSNYEFWDELENKYSSLHTLLRVTAFVKRFINNLKDSSKKISTPYLQSIEIEDAKRTWLKLIQRKNFSNEIDLISKKLQLKSSRLLKLQPFVDENGILRVGGRLQRSNLSYDERHPIILPDKDKFTNLLLKDIHLETMHGGTQLVTNILSRNFWLLNARNTVRLFIHKCINCYRYKASAQNQLMGNLPTSRVTMNRPFSHSGVDYCGPFELRTYKGKSSRRYKSYIALFICMSTKAIHLELVTDLSADGFMAAYRRFSSRRGKCVELYCDNGTNFVASNKHLKLYEKQMAEQLNLDIASSIEKEGVKFKFIPPGSPHFGGLWEAGVKSVKTHLKRVLGNNIMTYEDFNTILIQIEGCLNSRPITAMKTDINDLSALTPGHFLIGDAILTPPEPSILDISINRLNRWQYLQRVYQDFWKRWSQEYLNRLQQRPKWNRASSNVELNKLVLLKDENLPPSRWLLARVIDVHPGADGIVRVVTLKTKTNIIKRPVTKLCLLPIEN